MKQGILLCAVGSQKYYSMCNTLIGDIRELMPKVTIAVYTDNENAIVDKDIIIDGEHNPDKVFLAKIKACKSSPFHKTLFIDVDSRLLKPVYHLFELLENHHIAASYTEARPSFCKNDTDSAYNQYLFTTSTMLYTNDIIVNKLFEDWEKEYLKQSLVPAPGDQMYLSYLLVNQENIRYAVLPNEYRFNCDQPQIASGEIKIITSLLMDYDPENKLSIQYLNSIFNAYKNIRIIYFNVTGTYRWHKEEKRITNRIRINIVKMKTTLLRKMINRFKTL
jgi:hypothetical protein